MIKDALLSDCERYRYILTRSWNERPVLHFVMLNPSTADANEDDPTIRRCISFAQREGAGSIKVLNLFAYRATDPKMLHQVDDPQGDNLLHLNEALRHSAQSGAQIVCAWGVGGSLLGADQWFLKKACDLDARLVALGVTHKGHPRHPLYLRRDAPMISFRSFAHAIKETEQGASS